MILKQIDKEITSLDITNISIERKQILQSLIDYIQEKVDSNQAINLNFICTHNSRRSHLAQVWAQTLSYYYQTDHVQCYSGGTETTALFPVIAETLKTSGFKIENLSKGDNPIYMIKYAESKHPIIGFSKKYDASFNPSSQFAAIMTCSQADVGCPVVLGAEERILITYEDPKISDGTPNQQTVYLKRSKQIAAEMKYIFSNITT